MKQFIAVYLAPATGMEEWLKMDPEVRKTEEEKMKKRVGCLEEQPSRA